MHADRCLEPRFLFHFCRLWGVDVLGDGRRFSNTPQPPIFFNIYIYLPERLFGIFVAWTLSTIMSLFIQTIIQ